MAKTISAFKEIRHRLTENPEDKADLNLGDELVDGPERLFEH